MGFATERHPQNVYLYQQKNRYRKRLKMAIMTKKQIKELLTDIESGKVMIIEKEHYLKLIDSVATIITRTRDLAVFGNRS